ncbi:MAG: hypothetical protein HC802_00640 [Caldilineaceae bacterium]|nr:hypothetical protein [Caldilineaceae bacterium]
MTESSGYASEEDGIDNLTVLGFSSTATTATSQVQMGDTFSITHDFKPSATSALYQVDVAITNISSAPTNLLYRRVMDWDVEPTAFHEFVTIDAGNATVIAYTSDNGFASADPLAEGTLISAAGSFVDSGPEDHGALFDLDFGVLAPDETRRFSLYYGAAASEQAALDALAIVGAEAYSLGQPNTEDGPTLGTPNTFIFALSDVSGDYTTIATIDPLTGGLLTSADGTVSIEFPPGAVANSTTLSYTRFASAPPATANFVLAGKAFDISAADATATWTASRNPSR